MDINKLKIDSRLIEEGEWIGEKYGFALPRMGPGVAVKVRGSGNSKSRAFAAQQRAAIPSDQILPDGTIPHELAERLAGENMAETGLLDWEGFTNGSEPLPFSKELALEYLTSPDWIRFKIAVAVAQDVVGERRAKQIEGDAKN